jgi:hypothetical protein
MGFGFFGVVPPDALNLGDPTEEETIKISEGVQPNLTREGMPMVLRQTGDEATWVADDLVWQFLYGLDADDFRVTYLDDLGNWKEVPFQIDEQAYWRDYSEKLAFAIQATLKLCASEITVNRADVATWMTYRERHGFGRNVDTPNAAYSEPTKQECDSSYWFVKETENFNEAGGTGLNNGADNRNWATRQADEATNYALEIELIEDPATMLTPKNVSRRIQLPHRVDWDDQVCFMAKNGRLATTSDWWQVETYPERIRVQINDPVDGGQAWMYIYKKDDTDCTNNPLNTQHYYIPTGESDLVSWDSTNLKITAEKYELGFASTNMDLITDVSIKNEGQPTRNLMTAAEKFFASAHGRIYAQLEYSGVTASLTAEADTLAMCEGNWDTVSGGGTANTNYNDKVTALGYGLQLDLIFRVLHPVQPMVEQLILLQVVFLDKIPIWTMVMFALDSKDIMVLMVMIVVMVD